MKPDCVIFDLDGTLWDAIDTCVHAWNSVILEHQYPSVEQVSRKDFLASMGKNHREVCEVYFTSLPMPAREHLILKCYEREIPTIFKNPPKLYPGVLQGLRALKSNFKLGLVSNCQSAYLKAFIDLFQLNGLFNVTLCYGDTNRPKGETLVRVVGELSATSAVYVGDTAGDQKAAEFAGVPFYFAAYGFGSVDKYDRCFRDFNAIVDHLNSCL